MEDQRAFMERLIADVTIDGIDFACDLERLLAEEVKYLRHLINACNEQDTVDRDDTLSELRARIADKDEEISHLRDEVRFLRDRFAPAG